MDLEKTIKLYDADAYATEFEASVIDCRENKDGKYDVILDRTLFFPEEGGQSPDKGTVNGITVLDVQIKKDVITHTLDSELAVGEKVCGKIDWAHRYSNMQQHSGEHIFSGLVHSTYGYDNVGFHLSDQIVTMDFNGVLSKEQALQIEERANNVVYSNIEVIPSFPSKQELEKMEYRSKIEIEGQVRIVTIPGVDVCACCAPHVRRTGEIGIIKIMSIQSYKGGVRLSILCGKRALMAFREKSDVISELGAELSSNQEGLFDAVKKMKATAQTYKQKLVELGRKQLERTIEDLPSDAKDVVLFEEDIETGTMRNIINGLVASHDGICGIFNGNEHSGYSYILAARDTDMKEVAGYLRERLQAKGGGSSQMIQGSVQAAKADIEEALKNFSSR